MKELTVFVAALAALSPGCSESITVIVPVADGGAPARDAGPAPDAGRAWSCRVDEGAAWTELPPVATAGRALGPLTFAIAARAADDVLVGGFDLLVRFDGARLVDVPRAGLPSSPHIGAVGWHAGEPYVGLDGGRPNVFRWDGSSWIAEPPLPAPAARFFSRGGALLAFDRTRLHRLTAEGWVSLFEAGVTDVVETDGFVYAVERGREPRVQRSADGVAWEVVPAEAPIGVDLAAGGGRVYAIPFEAGAPLVLDESGSAPAFRRSPHDGAGVRLEWVGATGRVIGRRDGGMFLADAWGGEWRPAPLLAPRRDTNGLASFWDFAALGDDVVAISMTEDRSEARLLVSRAGAPFTLLEEASEPTTVRGIASDGQRLVSLARDARGALRLYRWTGAGWEERGMGLPRTPGGAADYEGVLGTEGGLLTRPGPGAQHAPFFSDDGAETWRELDRGFPTFASAVGLAYRDVGAFAIDAEGRLVVGTIGGPTSLSTGSGARTGRLPGSGVWRAAPGEPWHPLNAGFPVERGPEGLRGPPFRADVATVVRTASGLLAWPTPSPPRAVTYGVLGLVGDRWVPDAVGLPWGADVALIEVGDLAAARVDGSVFVRGPSGAWLPRSAPAAVEVWGSLEGLLFVSTASGAFVSDDDGEGWEALPPLDDHVVQMALDRSGEEGGLTARASSHRLYRLPIRCGGER